MNYEAAVLEAVDAAVARAMAAWEAPPPMTLDQWARTHFYLSAESSYVEQHWTPWPFQRAIMCCISNDDIEEVDIQKAARVGNTKIMLAAIGYFAQHRRRNQIIWQPTDDDRDEFVKTELDPMLRDVPIMQSVFPAYLARHKDNTLHQKSFIGSKLHTKGGKAAKNYRRVSCDVGYWDEISAFDDSIEGEGDAYDLGAKRLEGATFPKAIVGSTPGIKGLCKIEKRVQLADQRFRYHVPCVHCGEKHPLTWGGKDVPHGFKWIGREPETVAHLCRSCGATMTQADYLTVWEQGEFRNDDGSIRLIMVGPDARFVDAATGESLPPPRHVAFVDLWTAYSPQASWDKIVAGYLAAVDAAREGDDSSLITFTNTTMGRTWEAVVDKTEADDLMTRAESYPMRIVPMGGLILLAAFDTQDNRLEGDVWAVGHGLESWHVDHVVFYGNPQEDPVWREMDEFLQVQYPHQAGSHLPISGLCIDTRGHNTHAVQHWVWRHRHKKVFAIAGAATTREKAIKHGVSRADINWRGQVVRHGLQLWYVGTNMAKDLLYGRLQIQRPGPGYIHLCKDAGLEWFRQFAGEARAPYRTARGVVSRWVQQYIRVEAWDCATYMVWLQEHLGLTRKAASWWESLEQRVQPPTADLFSRPQPKPIPSDRIKVTAKSDAPALRPVTQPQPRPRPMIR